LRRPKRRVENRLVSASPPEGPRRRPILVSDLGGREEANMAYPGSRLVLEDGADEGDGWGFDLWQKSAMIQRRWSVNADPEAVLEWYRAELVGRGWTLGPKHRPIEADRQALEARGIPAGKLDADFYFRGAEQLVVRVFGRAAEAPFWMGWPPGGDDDDDGMHYVITLSDEGPEWRP
jgi:hypothetical protein